MSLWHFQYLGTYYEEFIIVTFLLIKRQNSYVSTTGGHFKPSSLVLFQLRLGVHKNGSYNREKQINKHLDAIWPASELVTVGHYLEF